jgi:3-isopropylmalate dehydrogenase
VREMSVAVLGGDGIGPEVVAEARRLLDAVASDHDLAIAWHEHLVGGASIDVHGTALTDEVLEACAGSDAVLLGAVGGPRWDTTDADRPRPEQGLLGLRAGLGLYANLRPVRPWPALYDASPLRRERIAGTDLLVVRELTGGLYFGERGREPERAFDTCVYTKREVARLAEWGFRAAASRRGKVTSVDKANVLETSRLWREQVIETAAGHPGVELEHMLVDNAAMQLVSRPAAFDVIVTENLFGDILSDEAAMITGSIGMLPSASLGPETLGLYEPVHGSAPDIAGRGVANPIATCLSAAMMLRYSLGTPEAAERIEAAVEAILADGARTPDLGGDLGTREVGDRLLAALGRSA